MQRYEVFPKNGGWRWRYGDNQSVSKKYDTRREAIAAARKARGDVREQIFTAAGKPLGDLVISRGPEAIALLRDDGSFHGEIDHELTGGTGQSFSIAPASETGRAVS